jgi:tRNA-splicing endonuclease subunit Sen2
MADLLRLSVPQPRTTMSLITPPSKGSKRSSGMKGGGGRAELNKIYAHPLPVVFIDPPSPRFNSVLGLLGLSLTRTQNPHCEGIFDPVTRSVWITNMDHSMTIWRRGFFGKGDLSRSEPSWLARQLNLRKSAGKRVCPSASLPPSSM